jgi:hypothetical protein
MAIDAQTRRRALGAIFLAAALLMLVLGQTVLRNTLSEVGFLIFWFLCFVSTIMAVLVAFWDLYAVRRRTREEQRALLEDTLGEIARREEVRRKDAKQS